MKREVFRLSQESFDLLVIGGGINGCAIARDAALRGIKTALIEKNDFACGASGKTTKFIHGGLRYLEQFDLKLVYESLHERAILLRTVPLRVKPLEFLIPVYENDPRPLLEIRTGIFLYGLLAGPRNIRAHRSYKKEEVLILEKNLASQGLRGGVSYFDAQMDDMRLCLDNAVSAFDAGASIANKVEVTGFIKEAGIIKGVEALDRLSGRNISIRAKLVVSATGAWSNRLMKLDDPLSPDITRPTKGVHIVYKNIGLNHAIFISAHSDKRMFFMAPWKGLTLIGTTDTDFVGLPDEVYADADEVEYLLDEAKRVFPGIHIGKQGVIATFAGLRPLVNSQGRLPWQISREYAIRQSASGLISVAGGKYTTYRKLAQQVVDRVTLRLRRKFKKSITAKSGPTAYYGIENAGLVERITQAVNEEMANSLNDLLVRRLQLSLTPGLGMECLNECADVMAGLLGWSDREKENQVSCYKEEVRRSANWQ